MTAEAGRRPSPDSVEAPLKYLADAADVPTYTASVGGGDTSLHEGSYVMQPVAIRDGRARAEGFSLDREGFLLVDQPTKVRDFYDDETTSNVAGPWPWRLLPLLDYRLETVLGHRDDVDVETVDVQDDRERAWRVRNEPAFGYNAMFVGGWWDKTDRPRYQQAVVYDPDEEAVEPDAPKRRFVPIAKTMSSVRRPDQLLIFTSSASRNPGIHKYDSRRDDRDGSYVVLPPSSR